MPQGNTRGSKPHSRRPATAVQKVVMPSPNEAEVPKPPVNLDDKSTMLLNGVSYEVRADDLVRIKELGRGAYGVVEIMSHPASNVVMAVKRIHVSLNAEERKRLQNEVVACMQSSRCPYMVPFYGAMFREGDVWICMEVLDSSMDKLINMCMDQNKRIPENILGKVAFSVLEGLHFMKEELNLMHRDIKPSNILVNRRGEVKICDFGISGHVTNSVAKTIQAGCKPYMAPERINPPPEAHDVGLDVRADVWSLGITMIELATGVHPYQKWKTPFEQLKQVVEQPAPSLPPGQFSDIFNDFIHLCLMKQYTERPKFKGLRQHPFVVTYSTLHNAVVAEFVCLVLDTCDKQLGIFLAKLEVSQAAPDLQQPPADSEPTPTPSPERVALNARGTTATTLPAGARPFTDMSSGSSSADSEKFGTHNPHPFEN